MAEQVEVRRRPVAPDGPDAAGDSTAGGASGGASGGAAPTGGWRSWVLRLLAARSSASRRRVWIARALAVIVDAVQLPLLPLLAVGEAIDIVIDIAMMIACTWLLGWHLVFLPSFVTEGVPIVDIAPTWTLAVWWATRGGGDEATAAPTPTPTPSRSAESIGDRR